MKRLIFIPLILFCFQLSSQVVPEPQIILEVQQKCFAKRLQNRFDKAIASNNYFRCNDNYCFEIDDDDLGLKYDWWIFRRWVIPRRMIGNYYPIYFFETEECNVIETELGEYIYFDYKN